MALLKSSANARYIRELQNVIEPAVIRCDGKTFSGRLIGFLARIRAIAQSRTMFAAPIPSHT
jgi:hypothetical protein